MLKRFHTLTLLCCIVTITVACYLSGLTGHFIFDDGVNIRLNPYLRIESLDFTTLWKAAFSNSAGPLGRPISTVSFAVNHYFYGMSPYHFKAVNLVIHLINGILVFALVKLLLGLHFRIRGGNDSASVPWLIGIAVATIWLLHPFNLTGVLYVVQRMTSLSALFTLVGMILYLRGRESILAGRRSGFISIVTALFVFTPLAALSKETGALLPLLIFVTEATLLRWHTPDLRTRRILPGLVVLPAAAFILLGALYLFSDPNRILGGYAWRDFSLIERLMTEARVLWFYLRMTVLPSLSEMGLHHDDMLISRSLLSPWTTLPAILGLLVLATGTFALRNKHPLITFGITFFFVAHALESTIIPLEIAFEHRNYLPMLGILVPLAYYALSPSMHLSSLRLRRIAFSLLIILFAGLTASRANEWGNTFLARTLEVERHPYSVRAHTDMAALYSHMPASSQEEAIHFYNKTLFHYQKAADIAPSSLSGVLGLLMVNAQRGIPAQEETLQVIEARLATVPFGPPNKNSLIGVARSIGREEHVISAQVVERLYRSALSNPRLTGDHRSQIISEFASIPFELRPKIEQGE